MLLNCPNCQSPVGGDAINIARNIGHCPECDHVFRISEAMGESFNNDHKTQIVMPDGIEVVPGLQLDIKLNWRKLSRLGSYFFIGFMFGTIPSIVGAAIMADEGFNILLFAFLSLFLLVGLYFLFRAFSFLLNTTYITASSFNLQVEHRPISFGGWNNLSLPREDITQLFVERHEESKTNNRPDYVYHLLAVLKGGKQEYLIKGLKKAEVAFYLEHQIEKRLGLQDEPMEGEFIPGRSNQHLLFKSLEQLEKMPKFLQRIVERQVERQQTK